MRYTLQIQRKETERLQHCGKGKTYQSYPFFQRTPASSK